MVSYEQQQPCYQRCPCGHGNSQLCLSYRLRAAVAASKQFIQTHPVTGVDRGSDWNGGKCAGFRGGAGAGGAFDLTSMRTEGLPALLMLLRMEFARDSVRGRANGWRALPPSGQALAMASMDDAVPTMRSYVATDEQPPCLPRWASSAMTMQMRKHHGSQEVAARRRRGVGRTTCACEGARMMWVGWHGCQPPGSSIFIESEMKG